MINVAVDSNVFAYAEGMHEAAKERVALDLLNKLPRETTLIPVQVLGELYSVLIRKARRSPEKARAAVLAWGDAFPLIESSPAILLAALDLAVEHRFQIWDAIVLAGAADAGCRLLLSEDLQDGFSWRGVTVTNPFSPKRHLLLEALLKEQ
jgi:predicted nucleic acid-binding protein